MSNGTIMIVPSGENPRGYKAFWGAKIEINTWVAVEAFSLCGAFLEFLCLKIDMQTMSGVWSSYMRQHFVRDGSWLLIA